MESGVVVTWFKVDDKFHSHAKRHAATGTKPLTPLELWLVAGSWAADQLTDGFIPTTMIRALGSTPSSAKKLVEIGLWESEDGGWRFHDWPDHQPTKESVLAKRDAEAERKAAWRAKRAAKRASDVP